MNPLKKIKAKHLKQSHLVFDPLIQKCYAVKYLVHEDSKGRMVDPIEEGFMVTDVAVHYACEEKHVDEFNIEDEVEVLVDFGEMEVVYE